jgi:hypothetical protein
MGGANDLGTMGPTSASGAFMTDPITTGGSPLDGYMIATKTGNRPTYVYPASPLVMDQPNIPVIMFSTDLIATGVLVGLIEHTSGNAIIATLVTDCSSPPLAISGAVVAVTQNGVPVGNTQDAGALDPQGEGAFITFDVPPGPTLISATYNGMTFRAHSVGTTGDATTATQIKPGY